MRRYYILTISVLTGIAFYFSACQKGEQFTILRDGTDMTMQNIRGGYSYINASKDTAVVVWVNYAYISGEFAYLRSKDTANLKIEHFGHVWAKDPSMLRLSDCLGFTDFGAMNLQDTIDLYQAPYIFNSYIPDIDTLTQYYARAYAILNDGKDTFYNTYTYPFKGRRPSDEWMRYDVLSKMVYPGGVGKSEAFSFIIGDTLYIGGGDNGIDVTTDMWKFNFQDSVWKQCANFGGFLSYKRRSAASFSLGTEGYVVGGSGSRIAKTDLKNDCWMYNAYTNIWIQKAAYAGQPFENGFGFSLWVGIGAGQYEKRGFVGGGLGQTGATFPSFYEFQPKNTSNGFWDQDKPIPVDADPNKGIYESVAFTQNLGGKIERAFMGLGKITETTYTKKMWIFQPGELTDGTWIEVNPTYTGPERSNAVGFSVVNANGHRKVLVMGGRNSAGILADLWEYDEGDQAWTKRSDFKGGPREGAVGFSYGNFGFCILGKNETQYPRDWWKYYPYYIWSPIKK